MTLIQYETPTPGVFNWETRITRQAAEALVSDGKAAYEPQSLQIYTKQDYLADPDIAANKEEFDRVSGEVFVAFRDVEAMHGQRIYPAATDAAGRRTASVARVVRRSV